MSAIISDSSFPVYVYNPPFPKAVDKICASEVTARLKEFITSDRIISITDNSYLNRELDSSKKAVLVLPGGETYALSQSLKELQPKILDKISEGWNTLGLCSGANVLCSMLHVKTNGFSFSPMPYWNCVPVFAYAPTPLSAEDMAPYYDYYGSIISINDLESNTSFSSFWNTGSGFNIAFFDKEECGFVSLAEYPDVFYKTASFKATRGQGTIVATGFHPEIDPVSVISHYSSINVKSTTHLEQLRKQASQETSASKEGRRKFLTKIFKEVGIEKESG